MAKEEYSTIDASQRVERKEGIVTDSVIEYEHSAPSKRGVKTTSVISVPASQVGGPEDERRFYLGEADSGMERISQLKARTFARSKIITSPQDSITVEQLNIMKNK